MQRGVPDSAHKRHNDRALHKTVEPFALGDRADKGIVRFGSKKAEITAVFDVSEIAEAKHWLIENELITNPDYKGEINKVFQQNRLWLDNNNIEKNTITIPIVVHVIYRQSHSNPGIGTNIPNFQIEDQIRILNEGF